MPSESRDYKREYKLFQSKPQDKKNRAKRNKARRQAEAKGIVKKGDGMDLHHVNGINSPKVKKMPASQNRAVREKSRLKGSTRKKHK